MFDKASLKLGLDKAVLQDINRKGSLNGVKYHFLLEYYYIVRLLHVTLYIFGCFLLECGQLSQFKKCTWIRKTKSMNFNLCGCLLMQVQQLSKLEVEDLLKKGAYGALMDEEDEGSKFCEEDIDQILQRRTQTITIQSEGKGSTFAKVEIIIIEY